MTSHDALVQYGDNFSNGKDAFEDLVSPVRRPIAVKDCLWEFLRMQPINEAPSRITSQSLPRATATAQTALETTTLSANIFSDNDKIIFEFPKSGFLDPLSIQMGFTLRCFTTNNQTSDNELFNYDITTLFTRMRLLYNEQEIEDIQRADLLAHLQSCLFDSPDLMYSQQAFLRGKHQVEDTNTANERRSFNRRNFHGPQGLSNTTQPFGISRRYMIPLPFGLFRQKKILPLHILNGGMRIELTVGRFSDVYSQVQTSVFNQPVPHEGRIEIGRPLLHAKLFKQGKSEVDQIFGSMLASGRMVYGFQSFQYNQFPIRVPTNLSELQAFQTKQTYDISVNMQYARYLIACVTLTQPMPIPVDPAQRYVNVTSTHCHNSWFNVQTKSNAPFGFHSNNTLRKMSQLYSFQLTYDGKPVTPEIKCSTNPSKYWKSTYSSSINITDNPSADDVSNNVVEPFFYYNHAVPLSCGKVLQCRNVLDFFQGIVDPFATSVAPGIRNDLMDYNGPAPLIMVVPLSSVLPNGEVAALSLGSGNEVLRLTLTWNSPTTDVMVAAVTDASLPTPFPPPIQLNTFICYDRLLTLNPDSSIVFEE